MDFFGKKSKLELTRLQEHTANLERFVKRCGAEKGNLSEAIILKSKLDVAKKATERLATAESLIEKFLAASIPNSALRAEARGFLLGETD